MTQVNPGDDVDDLLVRLPRRTQAFAAAAEVAGDLVLGQRSGEKSAAQRAVGDEPDAAAIGFPIITGDDDRPVNNAVPAWDVATGFYISNGIMAAEHDRRSSGKGQEITLALSDVMLATVGNLGYIAEVQATGKSRGALGNGLYGAYGQSFECADGRQVMVVVISNKHWRGLGKATGLFEKLEMIGPLLDVDLNTEGGRFEAREAIDAVVPPWFAKHTAEEAEVALKGAGVLVGGFQTFEELVNSDPRCSTENPMLTEIDQPGIGRVLAPRVPLQFGGSPVADAVTAPTLGGDAAEVLESELGLGADARDQLGSAGVVHLGSDLLDRRQKSAPPHGERDPLESDDHL